MAKLEVEVSFGATKGLPGYSSLRSDQRIRLEVESDEKDLPGILNDAAASEDVIRNHLVFGVADALGMEASMNEAGKAELVWPERQENPTPMGPSTTPPAPQPAAPAPQPAPQPAEGGGYGPPKATKEMIDALPRVILTIDGQAQQYIDQRPLKLNGTYKAGAADFKPEHGDGRQLWHKQKNGNVNADVHEAMQAAGVI